MFVVRTIIELLQIIGVDACSDLILSKIFNNIVPTLSKSISQSLSVSMSAAFIDCFFLLNGLLVSLTPETVKAYYLKPIDSQKISLASLLCSFPLVLYDEKLQSSEKMNEYERRYAYLCPLSPLACPPSCVLIRACSSV
jgi:hypothetical protein